MVKRLFCKGQDDKLDIQSFRTLWLTEKELDSIWNVLQGYRYDENQYNEFVEELLLECGVAQTRAVLLYPGYERLAVSLGKPESGIPLKLTSQEYAFLRSLPLTDDLKEVV